MASSFSFTPNFLTKDGRPWLPVMGEIHFSRVDARDWRDRLLKMKAGGVNIASTYVFWIHHEEIEGEWDFTGRRDLRSFAKACADAGLFLFLRIGPWCHGEARNGGFPDWLSRKGFVPRTNDERYFEKAGILYKKIFGQVEGLLSKDGGPVIGVQIENECGHCGGPSGEAGEEHIKRLSRMAREAGFDVPLMTATAWGGAATGGLLPVMGGYVDAYWGSCATELPPSANFLITKDRDDHAIGSDFGSGGAPSFDARKFPYLTAELGSGLEASRKRRPAPSKSDVGALTLAKLASGCASLGYFMYCGGTNPKGRLSSLNETRSSGSPNDLPEISYDFHAPVGEFGGIKESYGEIKLFALFANDFGSGLCQMETFIPKESASDPRDMESARWSWRFSRGADGPRAGYLFVNNHARHRKMAAHRAKTFSLEAGGETISFKIDVENGDYFFLPFNMEIGGATLKKAFASPLCRLRGETETFVFYRNAASRGKSDGELYEFEGGAKPRGARIVTLTREDASRAYKISRGQKDFLVITGGALTDDGAIKIFCAGKSSAVSIPEVFAPIEIPAVRPPEVSFKLIEENERRKTWRVDVGEWRGNECRLSLRYEGSGASLFKDGEKVADQFFRGKEFPFVAGLSRWTRGEKISLEFAVDSLSKADGVYLEGSCDWTDGAACALLGASAEVETVTNISV